MGSDHSAKLIYLAPVPWASFAQRSHRFVQWWHERAGAEVLWLDPYPTRLIRFSDLRMAAPKVSASAEAVPPWLHLAYPRALPVEPLPGATCFNRLFWRATLRAVERFADAAPSPIVVAGKPSRLALEVLSRLPHACSIYDAMDDFPAFYAGLSRRSMQECERALIARATRVLASSTASVRRLSPLRHDVVPVFNACDAGALPPASVRAEAGGHPVLGYVGTIGHWFDWDFVVALARQCPQTIVRLIGPVFVPGPAMLPANVELLPACSHADAMAAVLGFSVALIPFRQNRLTESVDPIKFYEYRGLGVPVISTAFGEMRERADEAGVFLASARDDLAALLERALAHRDDLQEIERFRAANDWRERFGRGIDGLVPVPRDDRSG